MRLNQPQDRMPPLQAPIPTNMVVSVSIRTGSLGAHDRQTAPTRAAARPSEGEADAGLLWATSEHQRPAAVHYVHHMQEGADDVSGLLIAALTASAHAIGRGSEGGCSTCDAVLLQPI